MRKRVLAKFAERGALLQPAALEYILSQPDPFALSDKVLAREAENRLLYTLKDVKQTVVSEEAPSPLRTPSSSEVPSQSSGEVSASEKQKLRTGSGPVILKDVTGNSTCCGQLQDFVGYFGDRMRRLRGLLRQRRELTGAVSISALKGRKHDNEVRTIGMVVDIRRTAGGRIIADIEDETGRISVLLPEDNGRKRINLMRDEVVGVGGVLGPDGNIIYVRNLVRPELPLAQEPHTALDPICVAFISDIHVGSRTFLEREWRSFIRWLKGIEGPSQEWAQRLEYLVICGDTVDGIGIYPGHEEDLVIKDVYRQYQELAEMLKEVPDRIRIIMMPGNHDAVRPAEPQPTFPAEIRRLFDSSITFTGNPCLFRLEGVEVLAYHGMSIADFVSSIPNLSFSKPLEAMKEMLRRRHLSPVFGDKTPIAPESRDWMVVDTIPDIFVTGHVHSAAIENFRGVTLINASAWQSQTEYQRMMNFQPMPARVALVNLQTMASKTICFMEEG
ncbi:MAG: DNA-directed DNA polymerase II small subunit [Thermoplasmata archaeon]